MVFRVKFSQPNKPFPQKHTANYETGPLFQSSKNGSIKKILSAPEAQLCDTMIDVLQQAK